MPIVGKKPAARLASLGRGSGIHRPLGILLLTTLSLLVGRADALEFEELAQPRAGYRVVSDLRVHGERLFVALNAGPLGSPGAAILSSRDGVLFETELELPDSEGILRLREIGGRLFAPEADPPGRSQGRIWRLDEAGFTSAPIADVTHSYDVAGLGGLLVAAGGGSDARGVLHTSRDGRAWQRVADVPAQRLRFMVVFDERVFVSKSRGRARSDYLTWQPGRAAVPVDAVQGEAHTWTWFAARDGRLLWSFSNPEARGQVRASRDGRTWEPVPGLRGLIVWDFAEIGDTLFALTERGLFASEGGAFRRVATPPRPRAFAPFQQEGKTVDSESGASLVAWRGQLFAGSLEGGRIYRVDVSVLEDSARNP